MRVLITRAEPAASRTADRLRTLGHIPVVMPIFKLVDTLKPIPEIHYDGVIFTSANAVEILAKRGWRPENAQKTAFCVGKRTAEFAARIGFSNCVVASGGGESLADRIEKMGLPENYRFLYPTTPDRSFDMKERLGSIKCSVETIDVYQTQKVEFAKGFIQETFSGLKNDVVLIYSARSANYLAELIDREVEFSAISENSLVGISKTATNIMLKYSWRDVYVSSDPSEDGMLRLLNDVA